MIKPIAAFVAGFAAVVFIGGLVLGHLVWNPGALVGAVTAAIVVSMIAGRRRTACPRCRMLMPTFRRPDSVKQALYGGWTCANCGCQMDRAGREIAPQGARTA